MNLIAKLAKGIEFTDKDLADHLYEICDNVHSSCDYSCPVYAANGFDTPLNENGGCRCFKNGSAMLEFIREKG
jgi:hypothetical protein